MDMQKSAANRVRHILQAMERSIDTARSRRTNVPAATPVPTSSVHAGHGVTGVHGSKEALLSRPIGSAQSPMPRIQQQQHAMPVNGTSGMIGGSHALNRSAAPAAPAAPASDPNQPARLKAKPKRFEGTFASQFPQNAQQDYRAQTG